MWRGDNIPAGGSLDTQGTAQDVFGDGRRSSGNGVRFKHDSQTGDRRGDAALGQVFTKTIDGSIDTLLCRLAADSEDLSHPIR